MTDATCSVGGCDRKIHAKFMCSMHYQRIRKGVSLTQEIRVRRDNEVCAADGCDEPARRKLRGMCPLHYYRIHRRKRESRIERLAVSDSKAYRSRTGLCEMDDCGRKHYAFGLCNLHWNRQRAGIALDAPYEGPDSGRFAGAGRVVSRDGYVLLMVGRNYPGAAKSGQIAEHRFVMQETLGRPLLPNENVHHKNGVRDDNRPENLELWVTTQPSGQRPEDLVAWAREILARYAADTAA